MLKKILVTGSSGLVGSSVCEHFDKLGYSIYGLDNNQRANLFGSNGDTFPNLKRLQSDLASYQHIEMDIRDRAGVQAKISAIRPDVIVHAAGQPSHDLAASIPFDDFEINAVGTLNMLEATRQHSKYTPFIYLSTNKVYGDRPNMIPLKEEKKRWEFNDPRYANGIDETLDIDQSTHSLFGVSKASADLMVQEYGRYFGMQTCCLRAGCLTGAAHSGVKLHGFLNYIVRCAVKGEPYTIIGYKGKQVRDNLDASDIASFVECFVANPRSAAIYNIGGGKGNSCSVLEAVDLIESILGRKMDVRYEDLPRIGDHICYYSDLSHIKSDYPNWSVQKSLRDIVADIIEATS